MQICAGIKTLRKETMIRIHEREESFVLLVRSRVIVKSIRGGILFFYIV